MGNDTIYHNCKKLLENEPELRKISKRKKAVWRYWQAYQGVGEIITIKDYCDILESHETISRRIRQVQEKYPELDDPENRIRKMEKSFQYTKKFSKNEPPKVPFEYRQEVLV
jgi:hypothetical protein